MGGEIGRGVRVVGVVRVVRVVIVMIVMIVVIVVIGMNVKPYEYNGKFFSKSLHIVDGHFYGVYIPAGLCRTG